MSPLPESIETISRLKTEIVILNTSRINLLEEIQRLGEYIRKLQSEILGTTRSITEEYARYVRFMQDFTTEETARHGNENNPIQSTEGQKTTDPEFDSSEL